MVNKAVTHTPGNQTMLHTRCILSLCWLYHPSITWVTRLNEVWIISRQLVNSHLDVTLGISRTSTKLHPSLVSFLSGMTVKICLYKFEWSLTLHVNRSFFRTGRQLIAISTTFRKSVSYKSIHPSLDDMHSNFKMWRQLHHDDDFWVCYQ